MIPYGVINFGMSMEEVGSLTVAEFCTYLEFNAEKKKETTVIINHATLNALANIYRGKGKPFIELFAKETKQKTREEMLEERYELFGY